MSNIHPEDLKTYDWLARPTLHPVRAKWLRRVDALGQLFGVPLIVIGHGLRRSGIPPWEFGLVSLVVMATITTAVIVRYSWSLAKPSFYRRHIWTVAAAGLWVVGMVAITIFGPVLPDINGAAFGGPRFWGYANYSELVLLLYSLTGGIRALRHFASGGVNPAFVLVASFLVLIGVGTLLLMLPICRRSPPGQSLHGAPWLTALFTSTSASCVTGLVVEHTGAYWSPVGHWVILSLFQIGGLGIMTFGAFFSVIAGKSVQLKEFANLRDLLSSDGIGDLRKMIFAILGFTLVSEFVGACCLWSLWADLPFLETCFYSMFHSVSAFCNAGFSLTDDSFVGMANHWQVGLALPLLIILGGLGFGVLLNVADVSSYMLRRWIRRNPFHDPHSRPRLRLTSKLVMITTGLLLAGGTVGVMLLDRTVPGAKHPISFVDAWFQSVTYRTAGFNTVDLGLISPANKLLAIVLMTVGASPGSTGGGVKTTVFALTIVGLVSVMRGRERIEAFGRTIPSVLVNRALAILFVWLFTVAVCTLMIVIFERRPDRLLDHLFEATSAAGTVGVSSSFVQDDGTRISVTQSLSTPSRLVLIFTMLLGRVGPLTLLLALAGESPPARYEYPPERVTLG